MASDISSGINSVIKILELSYQLKAVGEQTRDLLRITTNFARDLRQARLLRRARENLLSASDKAWMDDQIKAAEVEFKEVEKLIESARVDMSTKHGIDFAHRVLWVFRDNPKVQDKHRGLQMSHQSLMAVISACYSRDVTVVVSGMIDETQLSPSHDPEISNLYSWRNLRHKKSACFRGQVERPTSLEEPDIISNNLQAKPQSFSASLKPYTYLTPDQSVPHIPPDGSQPATMPYTPPISPPSFQLAGGQYIPSTSADDVRRRSSPLTPPQGPECESFFNSLPYPEDSTTQQAYNGDVYTTKWQYLQMPTPCESPHPQQSLQKSQHSFKNCPIPFTQPFYQPTFPTSTSPSLQFHPVNLGQTSQVATYFSNSLETAETPELRGKGQAQQYSRVPENNNPQRQSTGDRRRMRAAWFAHQSARSDFGHVD
ncbi:hypothetical protein MMC17_004480 [Xylographa soralifera]|nr:hypothetical protein [Xylographa soralifera]